jgi:hypothetical protein
MCECDDVRPTIDCALYVVLIAWLVLDRRTIRCVCVVDDAG